MFSKSVHEKTDVSANTVMSDEIFDAVQKAQENKLKGFLHDTSIKIWAVKDERGFTILHRAVFNNNEKMVFLIIEEIKKRLGMNSKKIIEKFINDKNQEGITALHYAAYRGNVKIAKFLCEYGATLDLVTARGKNVMHMAAEGNQPSIIVYFIYYHAQDVISVDDCGSTPLHWACYSGAEETVDLLLALNAEINAVDKEGLTPLHLAVDSNRLKVVLKLLQNGANKNLANKKGEIPLTIAEKKNYPKLVALLGEDDYNPLCTLEIPKEKIEANLIYRKLIYPLIIIPEFLIFFFVLPFIPGNTQLFINIAAFALCLLSYIGIYFKDPNYPKDEELESLPQNESRLKALVDKGFDLSRYCPTCHIPKSPTLIHCMICNKCVNAFDHHSFWLGKCIGNGNSFLYILFLFMAVFYCFHSMYISLYCFKNEFNIPEEDIFAPDWLIPKFDIELIAIFLGIIFLLGFFLSFPLVCLIFIYIFKKVECYYPPQDLEFEQERESKIKRATVSQELFTFRSSSMVQNDMNFVEDNEEEKKEEENKEELVEEDKKEENENEDNQLINQEDMDNNAHNQEDMDNNQLIQEEQDNNQLIQEDNNQQEEPQNEEYNPEQGYNPQEQEQEQEQFNPQEQEQEQGQEQQDYNQEENQNQENQEMNNQEIEFAPEENQNQEGNNNEDIDFGNEGGDDQGGDQPLIDN